MKTEYAISRDYYHQFGFEYLQPKMSDFFDGTIVSKKHKTFSNVLKIFEEQKYQKKISFMLKDKRNLYKIQKIFKDCGKEIIGKHCMVFSFYKDCMTLLLARFFFFYDMKITMNNISIFEGNL